MIRKLGVLCLGAIVSATASFAGIVTLVTSPAPWSNDSVTWGQLGADQSIIPNQFSATSMGGDSINGKFGGTTGIVLTAGSSWTPLTGAFANGDMLIWSFDSNGNAGTGPVTLQFPVGFGAGAVIQPDALGPFTAQVELFNGLIPLGSVTLTSNTGDAIFIGALDTTAEVTSAVFSLTAAGTSPNNSTNNLGDFALDTLFLENAVSSGAPEPGSLVLLGCGVAVLAFRFRRARRSI
jgi:hypothetical protein